MIPVNTICVSESVSYSLHEDTEEIFSMTVCATGLLSLLLSLSHTYANDSSMRKEMSFLRQSSTRIWNDAIHVMTTFRTTNRAQADLKVNALRLWRVYGSFFGLTRGTDVTTLNRPSELNEDLRYWKTPRHCSWPACPCAFPNHDESHRVRVCKGCWRVLYCSKQCQRG